ncbi:MAG: DUF3597 domain-containing protein [Verrucomicrobiota bacterium]
MFSSLMSKIFGHASSSPSAPPVAVPGSSGGVPAPGATTTAAPSPGATPAEALPSVDVTAILNNLAEKNTEELDWKRSIVDLLKLVGMDSSLSARKELATELQYSGDQNDSAAMNIWLHKAVLRKIAANGGKVPQDLLD